MDARYVFGDYLYVCNANMIRLLRASFSKVWFQMRFFAVIDGRFVKKMLKVVVFL